MSLTSSFIDSFLYIIKGRLGTLLLLVIENKHRALDENKNSIPINSNITDWV